jgi:hypothetical protein
MPYISQERRKVLDAIPVATTPGELNYVLTMSLLDYWKTRPQNYQTINDISGAATEALAEFRRRIVVDYENEKCNANGDLYD